jgi:hypothetical protein
MILVYVKNKTLNCASLQILFDHIEENGNGALQLLKDFVYFDVEMDLLNSEQKELPVGAVHNLHNSKHAKQCFRTDEEECGFEHPKCPA